MPKQIEDIILKNVAEFFKGDALKFFGSDKRIVSAVTIDAAARTEAVHVHIQKNISDWMLEADDGTLIHLEFASDYDKNDIMRYMVSDAMTHFKTGKLIKTIVVYTAKIKKTETKLDAGSINYEVDAFYMSNLDGDNTFAEIKAKIEQGVQLIKEDLMSIVFLPMMANSADKEEMFIQTASASKAINDTHEQSQVQAMIILLAEKFLNEVGVKKIKEEIAMSQILRMVAEENFEKNATESATIMLKDGMEVELVIKYTKLPREKVLAIKAELEAA